jgi:uncharacterized alkaline shock family protein YloU
MTDSPRSPGKTTIDPTVLHTIARLTALRVDGVSRLSPVPGGVNRLTRRGQEGVRIEVDETLVDVDVYVVLRAGTNVREVSRTIQNNVARAISEMVGMEVGRIGIHIEDIDYQPET